MSNPHVTLDPDPLSVEYVNAYADGWDDGHAAAVDGQRWRVAGLLLAALSGAIVGALVVVVVGALR